MQSEATSLKQIADALQGINKSLKRIADNNGKYEANHLSLQVAEKLAEQTKERRRLF